MLVSVASAPFTLSGMNKQHRDNLFVCLSCAGKKLENKFNLVNYFVGQPLPNPAIAKLAT
jgi:hypothetical protein